MNDQNRIQIFFSNDIRRFLYRNLKAIEDQELFLLGYKFNNIYIVFRPIEDETIIDNKLPKQVEDLSIIGKLNNKSKNNYDLNLQLDLAKDRIPRCTNPNTSIILFDPPNFKNLEYFSIRPILLQSIDEEKSGSPETQSAVSKLEKYEPITSINQYQSYISDDVVLDKINQLYRNRLVFEDWYDDLHGKTHFKYPPQLRSIRKSLAVNILVPLVQFIQYILIISIYLLNFKIIGEINLVTISKTFRQLDLRLKQFNYFPIQFLCYYDRNILYSEDSMIIKNLKLPIFNKNLNINNSNYINLYNSLWLIFNDILIGITVYQLVEDNFEKIEKFIRESIIQQHLFDQLVDLINWVSTKNPAGFKLNNELGKFMGDLYIWALWFWKLFVFQISPKFPVSLSIMNICKFLCYFGGFSFLLSFLMDCMNILTIHTYGFYYCSTRIYYRQIQILKSLFQLFRGKKYNVLRNRIDNLNNYDDGSPSFEIDQLLLGTLIFMILIFLLPTVFAFYFMFVIMHVLTLMMFNFLENIQIILNFTPLFVILLKLKNSKRLQGGINFDYIDYKNGTTYIKMSNKSLTSSEIFTNFIKLFKRAKNFRTSIIQNFFSGELIAIKYDNSLKFHYLMLPDEYGETINVWKHIK